MFIDPRYLLGFASFVVGLVLGSRSLENLKKIWVLLVLLFIYSLLLWPFFVEGETQLVMIGDYTLTTEGVLHGMGMGLRLDIMLISGVLLLSTMTTEEFAQALYGLGVPQSIGFSMSLAFRWVPSLLNSIGVIVQAQRSRGLDLRTGTFFGKILKYPPLVIPLIGGTLRRTNLLAMALESKGYGPGQHRHPVFNPNMSLNDYCVLAIMFFLMLGSIWMRLNGYGTI